MRIVILLLFSISTAIGQTITGIVVEADGVGIPDAHIRVTNTTIGTYTGRDGKFRLSNIPTGAILQVSSVGFAQVEFPATDTLISIELKPSLQYLSQNIVVTAQRYEANQFEVSESVTVLNSSDLVQQPPRSTPEALFGSAGIWIQKTNHGGGSPIIRGLVGNHILLMMDGIRLNNATYRYGPNQYLSTIDPGLVDRIEATRGNGSVLYGSDALGGVVQILSKNPFFSEDKLVSGNIYGKWNSNDLEKSLRSELHFSKRRIAAILGFSARDFGDIVAGDTLGELSPTGYQEVSGDAKIIIRSGTNGLLTVSYQHLTQQDVPRYDQIAQGGYKTYSFDPQTRQLAYVRWESATNGNYFQHVRITGSWNRSTEGIISQKIGSTSIKNQMDIVNTAGLITEVTSQWKPNWRSQTGFEFYYDEVSSKATTTDLLSDEVIDQRGSFADGATNKSLAIFSNHVVDWKKIQLTAGFRVNGVHVTVRDTTFGNQAITPLAVVGSLGVSYTIHNNLHWVISANSGFRAPNIDDMSKFGAIESTVFEIPSSNLAPEQSITVETGIKTNTEMFSSTLVFYTTRLFDLIDRVSATYLGQDSVENRKVYQKQNVGEAKLCGVEADIEFKLTDGLIAVGNLTYTYGQNISKDEPMRRIPPLFGKIALKYQRSLTWWAKTELLMAGSQDRLGSGDLNDSRIAVRLVDGKMPGWNHWNVYAGINMNRVSVTTSVQNILDRGYRVYGSGVDGNGRNFWIALNFRV